MGPMTHWAKHFRTAAVVCAFVAVGVFLLLSMQAISHLIPFSSKARWLWPRITVVHHALPALISGVLLGRLLRLTLNSCPLWAAVVTSSATVAILLLGPCSTPLTWVPWFRWGVTGLGICVLIPATLFTACECRRAVLRNGTPHL